MVFIYILDIAMRKSLTEVITIFQNIPVKSKQPARTAKATNGGAPDAPDGGNTPTAADSLNKSAEGSRVAKASTKTPEVTSRVPLSPEIRRVRPSAAREARVNFKKPANHEDTESSDVTGSAQPATRRPNREVKRRTPRQTKSSLSAEVRQLAKSKVQQQLLLQQQQQLPLQLQQQAAACDCMPILEKIGARLETDRKQIINQINDRFVHQKSYQSTSTYMYVL